METLTVTQSARTEHKLQIAGLSCSLFLPVHYESGTERYPVLYVNGEIPAEEILGEVRKAGGKADFILLCIRPENWNDDLTPWSAPAFRVGEAPPQGRAKEYLTRLTEEIKPYIDIHYRTKPEPEHTALFGYSLGGLTALYSIYLTGRFGWIGSLSGSLWYDGFCEFMEKEKPLRPDIGIYLSLGKKESLSRNPRMCLVAECTKRAVEILEEQLVCTAEEGLFGRCRDGERSVRCRDGEQSVRCRSGIVRLEWNEGGHFHETAKRFARAIIWWEGMSL